MKIIADQKRRVVLPKPARPGDVFDCLEVGDRFVLVRLVQPDTVQPPVSSRPLSASLFADTDLEEPAFSPLRDESTY